MSANALYLSYQQTGLSANERALIATLAYFARRNCNFATVGRKKLLEFSGLSSHYLAQTVDLLETKGYIEVVRSRNDLEPWKNAANTYVLKFVPKETSQTAADENDIFSKVFKGAA